MCRPCDGMPHNLYVPDLPSCTRVACKDSSSQLRVSAIHANALKLQASCRADTPTLSAIAPGSVSGMTGSATSMSASAVRTAPLLQPQRAGRSPGPSQPMATIRQPHPSPLTPPATRQCPTGFYSPMTCSCGCLGVMRAAGGRLWGSQTAATAALRALCCSA